jgi:tRNA-2-methylthio-N6-dimethylallyladenosine synthase
VKNLIKKGYKEITLLGQNVNSYKNPHPPTPSHSGRGRHEMTGEGENINFAKLLKKINSIPGNFWIRFLTSHPKDMSDELIEVIAKSKKVCEYIHLPIQAGNDKILEKMNRKYTAKHYLGLIAKIKKAFAKYKPNEIYSLNGDIIVGFPSETKKQFLDSAEIMKKVGYDMIFFGQFSPRPGTVAAKMKNNVSKAEKSRREKFLNEILKKTAFQNNQQYLGKTLEVLINKQIFPKAKLKDDSLSFALGKTTYFGRTRTMKNVKLSTTKKDLIGKIIKAKIIKANIWNLEGTIK